MELKAKDTYKIECSEFLSSDTINSLFSLYQPVIGNDAAALYMTLYSESRMHKVQETHSYLCNLMNLSIDDLERARIRLEEFMLLRCYAQENDNRTAYLYVLHSPLNRSGFFSVHELLSLYIRTMGQKCADLMMAKVQNEQNTVSGYKDITRVIARSDNQLHENTGVTYNRVKPRYSFAEDETNINFDYERFFLTTSTLVFPAELRTQSNLQLIGKLATVYGLSADRMRILVSKCTDVETTTFDGDKLKVLAAKANPDQTTAKDIYDLPPVSFLQAKQNGAAVSMADRKILEDLALQMKFAPDVINVMIEYILKKSQNRLVRSFVEMVAGEWARDGVVTREQAIAETKKRKTSTGFSGKVRKESVLPAYMKELDEVKESENQLSKEEQEELQALMRRMGGMDE